MKDLGIFILAGGKSKRFGENKAYQKIQKKTFLTYLIDKLKSVAPVYVVKKAKKSPLNLKNFYLEPFEEYAPLLGIYYVLKKTPFKFNLFIPVDMPLINANLLKILISKRNNSVFVYENEIIVFPLLLRKEVFMFLEEFLKKREYTLKTVINALKITKIKLEKIYYNNYLRNFNYKEDLNFLY